MSDKLSRRRFLRGIGATAAAAAATACQPKTVIIETEREVTKIVEKEKVVTQVVEVEKEVTKIVAGTSVVEKVVETKVVEKLVTATPEPAPTVRPGGWVTNWPPFEKYDPARYYSVARSVGTAFQYVKGDSAEYWTGDRVSEELTGIRFVPKYLYADSGEGRQKLNLAIAANDLPDVFGCGFDTYGQLVQAGMIMDITDMWEKYAPQYIKDEANWSDGLLWEPLRVNGRVYGTPGTKGLGQDEKLTWIRRDWMDKLGLTDGPKTLDDLHDFAAMFIEAKLAGEDRETIGLPMNMDLNTWICSTDPIFGGYGVMPGYWRKMPDGSAMYMSLMEEGKEVLALLAEWYAEGLINKEFFTLPTNKSAEGIVNGQVGMYFGPFWCPRWPNPEMTKNEADRGNPDAIFDFFEIPAGPAGQGTKFTLPVQSTTCVNANLTEDDFAAIIKHAVWVEEISRNAWEVKFHGFEGYSYVWTEDGCALPPVIHERGLGSGLALGTRVFGYMREFEYDDFLKQKYDEDPSQLDCYERAIVEATFSPESAAREIQVYEAYKIGVDAADNYSVRNDYTGLATETMIAEQGNLNALEQAAYIDMIVGNQPISYFDEFVKQWKAQGGDQIKAEIEEKWNMA